MTPARRSRPPASKPSTAGTDERPRRPQGRRTRSRLLEAGMAVLAEKGYHAVRVDDIVRAADVSHGTFYLYFANKQELLVALASGCAAEMTGVVAGLGPVDRGPRGRAELRRWLGAFVSSYRRFGVVTRAWMEGTVSDHELVVLGEETFGVVVASLGGRLPRSGREPGMDAVALLALIERFTYYVTSRSSAVGDDAMVETLAALVHRGWFGGTPDPIPAA